MTEVFARYALAWALAGTAASAACGWVLARWAARNEAGVRVQPAGARLTGRARRLLAGLAVGGTVLFGLIVAALAQPGPLDTFDQGLAIALQHSMSAFALRGVALFTTLGDRTYLMGVASAVLVILLWRKAWLLAGFWVLASAGGGTLNKLLKATFERVRPDHVHGFVQTSGFSFPSGHATGAVAVYAMLAFVLLRFTPASRHPAIFACATALVVGVGLSRVLLHVHYVSDVLAGWAITGAWVALCVLALDVCERLRPRERALV